MTVPQPVTAPDDAWTVDERSLELFTEQLKGPPGDRVWHELRREAERLALVPGFEPTGVGAALNDRREGGP